MPGASPTLRGSRGDLEVPPPHTAPVPASPEAVERLRKMVFYAQRVSVFLDTQTPGGPSQCCGAYWLNTGAALLDCSNQALFAVHISGDNFNVATGPVWCARAGLPGASWQQHIKLGMEWAGLPAGTPLSEVAKQPALLFAQQHTLSQVNSGPNIIAAPAFGSPANKGARVDPSHYPAPSVAAHAAAGCNSPSQPAGTLTQLASRLGRQVLESQGCPQDSPTKRKRLEAVEGKQGAGPSHVALSLLADAAVKEAAASGAAKPQAAAPQPLPLPPPLVFIYTSDDMTLEPACEMGVVSSFTQLVVCLGGSALACAQMTAALNFYLEIQWRSAPATAQDPGPYHFLNRYCSLCKAVKAGNRQQVLRLLREQWGVTGLPA